MALLSTFVLTHVVYHEWEGQEKHLETKDARVYKKLKSAQFTYLNMFLRWKVNYCGLFLLQRFLGREIGVKWEKNGITTIIHFLQLILLLNIDLNIKYKRDTPFHYEI